MRAGALALAALAAAVGAGAEEAAAPPPYYVAGFLGTSLAYRPPRGSFHGYQHDLTPLIGYGRFVTPSSRPASPLSWSWTS